MGEYLGLKVRLTSVDFHGDPVPEQVMAGNGYQAVPPILVALISGEFR